MSTSHCENKMSTSHCENETSTSSFENENKIVFESRKRYLNRDLNACMNM